MVKNCHCRPVQAEKEILVLGLQPQTPRVTTYRYMQPTKVEDGGALVPIMPYYDEETDQPFDFAPQWLSLPSSSKTPK